MAKKALNDLPTNELFERAQWELREVTRALIRGAEEAHSAEALLMVVAEREEPTHLPDEALDRVAAQLTKASASLTAATSKWKVLAARRAKK